MTLQDLRGNLKESDNCLDIYKDNSDLEELEIKPDEGLNGKIKPRSNDKAKGEDLFNDVCGMYKEIANLMGWLLDQYCSIQKCDEDYTKNKEIRLKIYNSKEYKELVKNFDELKNKRKGYYYDKYNKYLTVSSKVLTQKGGYYNMDYNVYRYGTLLGVVHKHINLIKGANTSKYIPYLLSDLAEFVREHFLYEEDIMRNCFDGYAFAMNLKEYQTDENYIKVCNEVIKAIANTTESFYKLIKILKELIQDKFLYNDDTRDEYFELKKSLR